MLKVSNIRLPVGAAEELVPQRCAARLKVPVGDLRQWRLLRKSLDVRDKRRLEYVYTVAVALDREERVLQAAEPGVALLVDRPFVEPTPGPGALPDRPVIVGSGPAGLLAAFQLARHGYAPLLLERGREVSDRIPDVRAFDSGGPLEEESNYLFGEGGAGTFSDGKLTCRTTGPETDRVLQIFADHKGRPSILYEAKPHLGSNRLPAVVKALRRSILAHGGEVRFGCRVDDLLLDRGGTVVGVRTNQGDIPTSVVILAIGHSARDTFAMLHARGVPMEPKPFQLGLRIEQPQAQVNAAQYGDCSPGRPGALLGPADYTMNVQAGDRDVFSFCMCAGGYVMPSVAQAGYFCTNGMSRSKHESPFANSGIMITLDPAQLPSAYHRAGDPRAGIVYQAEMEQRAYEAGKRDYLVPIQRARDFIAQRPSHGVLPSSYERGQVASNLWEILPADLCAVLAAALPLMDRRWRGEFLRDATVVGPEARGSCPVRLPRDPQTREARGMTGLYPIGEGAGYAGGIISAAVDGLRTANALIERFQPIQRP